jgi:hypothetical protein
MIFDSIHGALSKKNIANSMAVHEFSNGINKYKRLKCIFFRPVFTMLYVTRFSHTLCGLWLALPRDFLNFKKQLDTDTKKN